MFGRHAHPASAVSEAKERQYKAALCPSPCHLSEPVGMAIDGFG